MTEVPTESVAVDDEGTAEDPGADLRSRVRAFERSLLMEALSAAGGHQRRAAAMLGLLPTTFHEKLKRHRLLPHLRPEETTSMDADRD
ncbi:MAG TPA: helix-turn-helix domain-containing protein [Vicinamibacteria bacterium]|nr:helix-turn-helix domain-containing protein [Vicinamibacteria bacterium]